MILERRSGIVDIFYQVLSSTSDKKRGFIQKEFKFALEMLKEIPEDEILSYQFG
jgi:hypothetical protein